MFRRIFLVALCLAIGSAGRASAAPFTNGSFELATADPGVFTTVGVGSTLIPGWEVFGSNIDYIGTFWQASDGVSSVDLNGNNGPGGIRQTFDTVTGQRYQVTFDYAAHHVSEDDVFTLRMSAAGMFLDMSYHPVPGSTRADMRWREQHFTFLATGDVSTLSFLSLTTDPRFGPAIDHVTVTPFGDPLPSVPEPATLSLVGLGLIGGALRARYHRWAAM
jgi:choice-of-anchor C domain-containing protein